MIILYFYGRDIKMVHTFELSKEISKDIFDDIRFLLHMRWYGGCFITTAFAGQGFQIIRLYEIKREMHKGEIQDDNVIMHLYMISLSINTAHMFGGNGDPHMPQSILSFTPGYVRAIYRKIFELIPFLEVHPEWCFDACWDEAGQRDIVDDGEWLNHRKELDRKWMEANVFKARRIDFTFDLKYMNQQYLTLINRGYSLRKKVYERTYYEDKDTQEKSYDDESDIPDSEEILQMMADEETGEIDGEERPDSGYCPDVNYIYYKSDGVNINIYHKGTEIEKRKLASNPDADYDFLRIEVQVKKSKLNAIVSKFGLNKGGLGGRGLEYLISPEIEHYILDYYVNKLTGTGFYVTYDRAMKMIDESRYTKTKKERMKKVIDAVAKKHGIAKVLEQVENGMITDLGKLSTVKQYLRDIHDIGINPVTLSARMGVSKQILKDQSGGEDLSEKVLPSLVDILSAYGDQTKDYQLNSMPITDEDLKEIDKL